MRTRSHDDFVKIFRGCPFHVESPFGEGLFPNNTLNGRVEPQVVTKTEVIHIFLDIALDVLSRAKLGCACSRVSTMLSRRPHSWIGSVVVRTIGKREIGIRSL